jgi:hypothetical protein
VVCACYKAYVSEDNIARLVTDYLEEDPIKYFGLYTKNTGRIQILWVGY